MSGSAAMPGSTPDPDKVPAAESTTEAELGRFSKTFMPANVTKN